MIMLALLLMTKSVSITRLLINSFTYSRHIANTSGFPWACEKIAHKHLHNIFFIFYESEQMKYTQWTFVTWNWRMLNCTILFFMKILSPENMHAYFKLVSYIQLNSRLSHGDYSSGTLQSHKTINICLHLLKAL